MVVIQTIKTLWPQLALAKSIIGMTNSLTRSYTHDCNIQVKVPDWHAVKL